jgi:hypothetical protein
MDETRATKILPVDYKIRTKGYTTTSKTPDVPKGRDTFETPNYATDLLVPFIPERIHSVWECACGGGKISARLKYHGYSVFSSDIRDGPNVDIAMSFLKDYPAQWVLGPWFGKAEPYVSDGVIITNPPYSIKEEFIERGFELKIPFAFLINADYSGMQISWIQRGCEKIIPNRRIDFITPTGREGKNSASQFHSMWLTWGFNLGRTETFVDLPLEAKKNNI